MSTINENQWYENFAVNQSGLDASIDPILTARVADITEAQAEEYISRGPPRYLPPVEVVYRQFSLKHENPGSLSPVDLFLLFFGPVLDLLLFHTNVATHCKLWKKKAIRPIAMIELKRWVACRIDLGKYGLKNASFRHFWSTERSSMKSLSLNRFLLIEHFVCLANEISKPSPR